MAGKFNIPSGEFIINKEEKKESIKKEKQEVQEAQEKQKEKTEEPNLDKDKKLLEIGKTQGKKGEKLPRINIAFSTLNHEFITRKSRRAGLSATAFVNAILDKAREGEVDITKWFDLED